MCPECGMTNGLHSKLCSIGMISSQAQPKLSTFEFTDASTLSVDYQNLRSRIEDNYKTGKSEMPGPVKGALTGLGEIVNEIWQVTINTLLGSETNKYLLLKPICSKKGDIGYIDKSMLKLIESYMPKDTIAQIYQRVEALLKRHYQSTRQQMPENVTANLTTLKTAIDGFNEPTPTQSIYEIDVKPKSITGEGSKA